MLSSDKAASADSSSILRRRSMAMVSKSFRSMLRLLRSRRRNLWNIRMASSVGELLENAGPGAA